MKKIILLFILVFGQKLHAANTGGGTVVGNGAGLVESSFQQAYYSLAKIIPGCTIALKCGTLEEENVILNKILTIVNSNVNRTDRLVFISERLSPGFFTTGSGQTYRIAKTFLYAEAPIFINTDLLYTNEGKPAINFQDIVRILIHEIGHQTGVTGHASLDMLGVKVSAFSDNHTSYFRYKVDNRDSKISFAITNLEYPVKSTFVLFNWKDEKVIDLSDTILNSTACTYDSENYVGAEVSNGHYDVGANGLLSFQAWLDYNCFDRFSEQIIVYRKNLTINLGQDFQFLNLKVK